ncbi:hypothetical protein ACHAXR_003261 [Thalassiosira sp. AJA248-18]
MKLSAPLLVAVASLTGGSITTTPPIFASAQQTNPITVCSEENIANCIATANRTCYNYEESNTHKCGYCINGFFEYEDECYAIDDIGTDGFLLLSTLLELFLPEYVDQDVSTEDRALRLIAVTKIVSFWNSQVPPPEFELGLTDETFLTEEERMGRLGISSKLSYDESKYLGAVGSRGEMVRFGYDGEDKIDDEGAGDRKMRRLTSPTTTSKEGRRGLEDTPDAIDWEAEGYTTIPKNQGLCGCCWAVSTAGAVESALMITGQTSRYDSLDKNSLSFQQMISCDKEDLGCQGGNILQAARYVWEHNDFDNGNFGGLYSEVDWPYSDLLGQTTTECDAEEKIAKGKTPAAYLDFPKVVNGVNDRSDFYERRDRLMAAVAQQPAMSVLRSGCALFSNYKDGVLTHDESCQCCDVSCIDHAVVIVGYNATAPTPYWKLRNSWGVGWGEEGHFRIAMNDPGCGWGLFGMLAESAVPSAAYKNLEDLPERPGWWETAQTWEKTMVILFSILGFCCLCGCLGALWNKRK